MLWRVLGVALTAPVAASVRIGDMAPLFPARDENLEIIHLSDYVDGMPLVFVCGSAT